MGRLSGRVVAITGASAGIGRACAELCAAEGAAVVVSARRADRLQELVAALESRGGRALAVPGDVTREADMTALVDQALATFGSLDVMVCNAGIGYHGALDDTPPEVMRRLVDVNVMGTFYAASAALPVFRRQGRGHIIAVSSIAGRRGVAGTSVYGATKAAQLAFIESLRAEFVGSNLHASVIVPVVTSTEFHQTIERDFGHPVKSVGPRQSAAFVAERIVRCIASPKAEVYPYRLAWWLAAINLVAPRTTDRVMKRFARKRHAAAQAPRQEPPA